MFAEAGVAKIKNKDVLELTSLSRYHLFKKMDIFDLDMALSKGDYFLYPYNIVIENELRTKYLLQTEASDDFQDLVEELFMHLKKHMSESDVEKISNALDKAKKRVYNQTINFLDPYKGLEEGEYRKLSNDEKEKNLIHAEEDIYVDKRTERFDLLALKELILVLRGDKEVDKYSIGIGFFNKFIPELQEEGISGIVMHVKNNQFKSIKAAEFKSKRMAWYSPINAAVFVRQEFLSKNETKPIKVGPKTINHTEFSDTREIEDDEFFLVSVDGAVANQEDINLIGYSGTAYNNKIEKAGETFLMDSNKMIRLYFTPYNYKNFPLIHNHGSVIFGSNDQTYHSVFNIPEDKYSESMRWKLQDNWNKVQEKTFNLMERYCPAVISLQVKNQEEDPIEFFKLESNVQSVVRCLAEESTVSRDIALTSFWGANITYSVTHFTDFVDSYVYKNHPLSKTFNLKKYVETNDLADELQDTWIYKQCKKVFRDDTWDSIRRHGEEGYDDHLDLDDKDKD